ncbi:glycosyltransferase [Halpernia sp.]|uniref:glycosyltransferase n=1 Tax=Halpernia sp. TaxID=2782209 RepID=UPI003A93C8D2
MILIDTVFIVDGGGKILLEYLVSLLDFKTNKFVFLLDFRMKSYNLLDGKEVEIHYAKNLRERNKFYLENQKKFKKVFCLGNIPPPIKISGTFINYLHSSYYVSKIDKSDFRHYIITNLKKLYFNFVIKNVDLWIVQTKSMQRNLSKSKNVDNSKIKILPFYKELNSNKETAEPEKNTFLYVSDGGPRKNHKRLLDAFCKFYDDYKIGKLLLTISDSYPNVKELIEEKTKLGYPITNCGFVDRDELKKIYLKSSFAIYPSLTESFGLGLVEACECNCKILAANLDYVFDVCEPSHVFNPYKTKEIYKSFQLAVSENLPNSKLLIKSRINDLLKLIEN